MITGNLYILAGIALFALLVALAVRAAGVAGSPGAGRLTAAPAPKPHEA
jgi:hypothetical protein